jgi:hypothetical protein
LLFVAVVAKVNKPAGNNSNWEVIVRFDDDVEDGKIPPRRVPARFVLKRSDLDASISSFRSV